MKKMNRLLSLLLAAAITASSLTTAAYAADAEQVTKAAVSEETAEKNSDSSKKETAINEVIEKADENAAADLPVIEETKSEPPVEAASTEENSVVEEVTSSPETNSVEENVTTEEVTVVAEASSTEDSTVAEASGTTEEVTSADEASDTEASGEADTETETSTSDEAEIAEVTGDVAIEDAAEVVKDNKTEPVDSDKENVVTKKVEITKVNGVPEEAVGGELNYSSFNANVSGAYKVTADELTYILRGLDDSNKKNTFNMINKYISEILATGKTLTLTNPDYIDAEKYSAEDWGYDSQHCWAATASNILWTTGYAQKAVNPMTKKPFKSEDELLTYFSENFTDYPGRPSDACTWFFDGSYALNNEKDVAHQKKKGTGKLLPNVDHTGGLINVVNNSKAISALYSVASYGMGVLIKGLVRKADGKIGLSDGGHWMTAVGVVLDSAGKTVYDTIKAIIVADSDNAPVNGDLSASTAKKLTAKSNQENNYTVYRVEYVEELDKWIIDNFNGKYAAITFLYALLDSDKKSEGEGDMGDDDYNVKDTINSPADVSEDVIKYVDALNKKEIFVDDSVKELYLVVEDPKVQEEDETAVQANDNIVVNTANSSVDMANITVLTEADFDKQENIDLLKIYMVENHLPVYVMNNGLVGNGKDCVAFVNIIPTMICDIQIDGESLSNRDYTIIETKSTISKLVISKDYLGQLTKGTHAVKIILENSEVPTEFNITVE